MIYMVLDCMAKFLSLESESKTQCGKTNKTMVLSELGLLGLQ